MTKEQLKEKMIDRLMSDFDFEKVHRIMKELNWRWWQNSFDDVPTIYMLISRAKELLSDAFENKSRVSTGGFIADYNEGVLTLCFTLEIQREYKEDYDEEND